MTTLMNLAQTYIVVAVAAMIGQSPCVGDQVSYLKRIRPILSNKCFTCHGPDEATREADLRLDTQEGSRQDLGGYAAVVEGDSAASELMTRLLESDPDLRMPPESSGKKVSPEEVELLRKWIEEGANYETHWSFGKVKRPPLPKNGESNWEINPIDQFILARLSASGLKPSPPADRYQLVRRVYLDLLGIPPTSEEVDAFVDDESPTAYEHLVDRLLASPHYGERWARRWLDLARYADTKGYEKDQPRVMWPYRDWVINAINDDMPFDQFTIEQLAGDMLPAPTASQLVATGFHRNTMTNEEGGIDPQEFRFLSVVDRVATTGSTWLGLTYGCAQCHTHKYDPITQKDYFRLFAVLNNADELEVEIPIDADDRRTEILEQISQTKSKLRAKLENELGGMEQSSELAAAFETWLAEEHTSLVHWAVQPPVSVDSNLPTTQVLDDNSILVSGDETKGDVFTVYLEPSGPVTAMRVEALPNPSLPRHGPGRQVIVDNKEGGKGNFFLSEVTASIRSHTADGDKTERPLSLTSAFATFVPPELDANNAIDGRPDTGWTVDGQEGKRHCLVVRLAERITLGDRQQLVVQLRHDSYYPASLGCFRISTTDEPSVERAAGHTVAVAAAIAKPAQDRNDNETQLLVDRFLEVTPLLAEEREAIAELESSMPSPLTALVFQERVLDPRTTRRHHRGEYLQPKEVVSPAVPEFLPPLPPDQPANRLTIARWLVDRKNPLTARVVVNRWWEAFFGVGLVKTTADFGTQGEYPSHPGLLDWLAAELMESGWSRKHLHRLIVTSQTYRQSSNVEPEHLHADPENRLLARMPRLRMEAETVRDIVLRASGMLSETIGGPSVFPPQPTGITEAAYGALNWNISDGEDRYRRGMYTFAKRTAPYAAFGLFDCPSGEACVPRRDRSSTPLQSLNMLNDEVVAEAARALAIKCCNAASDSPTIAERMFQQCVSRPPTRDESLAIVGFFDARLDELQHGDLIARQILRSGPSQTWTFDIDAQGWQARSDVRLEVTHDGELSIENTGDDPHIGCDVEGPAGEYVLDIEAHFGEEDTAEVFWTTLGQPAETPANSVAFKTTEKTWDTYRVKFDVAEDLRSIRIDPGTKPGVHQFKRLKLTAGDGLVTLPAHIEPNRLAAWQLVARALLNLDEVITKP